MQAKGWLVHILNPFRGVERRQDQPQPIELVSFELPPIVLLEQKLQAFMPETLNHRIDCKTSIDICQHDRRLPAYVTAAGGATLSDLRGISAASGSHYLSGESPGMGLAVLHYRNEGLLSRRRAIGHYGVWLPRDLQH